MNILDAKADYGAAGDGTTDDTTALQNWLSALGAGSWETSISGAGIGFLPAGKYKHTSTLTIPDHATVFGAPLKSTFMPTSAVSTAAVIQGLGSTLDGIAINGVNASAGVLGLSVGASGLANNGITRQVLCGKFTGSGSAGLKVFNISEWAFQDCIFTDNQDGAEINYSGTGGPTTVEWDNCVFKSNAQYGLFVATGQGQQFRSCVFELNQYEGAHVNLAYANGGTIQNITFDACHFENNQLNYSNALTGGVYPRHAYYHAYVRAPRVKMRNCFFSHDGDGARAIQWDQAVDGLVDHCDVNNEAGAINVTGSSSKVHFTNWPTLNGTRSSTVSVTSGATATGDTVGSL